MRQEEYPHTYGFLSFVASLVAALAFAIKQGGRVVGRVRQVGLVGRVRSSGQSGESKMDLRLFG